jgi:hypothetical protein
MSEIIKVEDAPPLPYNLKSKKRAARRVQSIHHLVERTPSEKELLDPEAAAKEKKEKPPAVPRTHSISVSTNTFDDDMTTTNSESDNASHHSGVSSAASSTPARGSPLVRTKTMLVPCRLGSNPSSGLIRGDDTILKGSSAPRLFLSFFLFLFLDGSNLSSSSSVMSSMSHSNDTYEKENPDLNRFIATLSLKQQTKLATLLSSQEAQFGFNMFEALIAGDKNEITRLMNLGYRYDESVLMIFEKRYVTKPDDFVGMYANVELLNHPNNAYYSAPNSPNISADYSNGGGSGGGVMEHPNYSIDYMYSMPSAASAIYHQQQQYQQYSSSTPSPPQQPSPSSSLNLSFLQVPPPFSYQSSSPPSYQQQQPQNLPHQPPFSPPYHRQSSPQLPVSSPHQASNYSLAYSPSAASSSASFYQQSPTSPSYHAGGVASLPPRVHSASFSSSSPAPFHASPQQGIYNDNIARGRNPVPASNQNINYSRTASFHSPSSAAHSPHNSPYVTRTHSAYNSREPSPSVRSTTLDYSYLYCFFLLGLWYSYHSKNDTQSPKIN